MWPLTSMCCENGRQSTAATSSARVEVPQYRTKISSIQLFACTHLPTQAGQTRIVHVIVVSCWLVLYK
jgi:hypothetical protein